MFFDVVPFLQIEKIFRTLFAVFTPSRPCANDDTLKFFFIQMFQFFFRRIKMPKVACIFIGRVTFERFLCIVKFILQYVLLIFFFSFALRFENCTACALRLYLIQSQIHLWSGRSHLPSAGQTGILAVTSGTFGCYYHLEENGSFSSNPDL